MNSQPAQRVATLLIIGMLTLSLFAPLSALPVLAASPQLSAIPVAPEIRNPEAITAGPYAFSSASGVALADMSSGTTQLVAASQDDTASALTNLGFDFWYDGVRVTQFSVNANGLLRLGSAVTDTAFSNSLGSTTDAPKIAGYWDDLCTGTAGKVHYKVLGSAPNRQLVVEFKNMQFTRNAGCSGTGKGTFQVWLFESGHSALPGVIEFVYGAIPAASATDGGYSIGLQSGAATYFASVTTSDATVSNATANNTQTNAITAGTAYVFTPNVPAAPAATPMMYVVNGGDNTISRANLDGTGGVSLGNPGGTLNYPMSIALNLANGKMYISNYINNTISRANLDGTGGVSLGNLGGTLNAPYGIALDVANNKIYIVNNGTDTISRANLDGTGGVNLGNLGGTLNGALRIALDVANNKMYVVNVTDTVSRANLDGTGGVNLGNLGGTINGARSIALDLVNNQMYVLNDGSKTVSRANLDGTGGVNLGNLGGLISAWPLDIALDVAHNKMYIVDYVSCLVIQANLNGTGAVNLGDLGGTLNSPYGIALDLGQDTTTTLASSANPSMFGQSVTFTATVAPAPSGGTVAFKDGGTIITGCGAQALTGGPATCTTSAFALGSHVITAEYSGYASYNASLGALSPDQQVNCSSAVAVANANDSGAGSLRQAIADACSGGTITFNGDYTILLASELAINKNMTIDGAGHNVTVSGNHAVRVFNLTGGTITLNQLTIADGYFVDGSYSGVSGAGLRVNGSTLNLTNSTISGNVTGWPGGGGLELRSGAANVSNSAFIGNSGNYGGGIDTSSSTTLNVTNSTFSGNSAASAGGGLSVAGTGNIINSTISGNSSGWADGGGGINNEDGAVTVSNSIIANNPTGGNCFNHYPEFSLIVGVNSLTDDSSCGSGFTQSSSILLSTLGSYGGSTKTFALLPGSSAIDTGDDAICAVAPVNNLDQRGIARPQGAHCDVGAFESRGFTLAINAGDNQHTNVNTAFTNSLQVTVASNTSPVEPVNGGKVTFTPPGSGASTSISGNPATIASGSVSVTAVANGVAGGPYLVNADAAGANNVDFTLTNDAAGTTTTLTASPNPSVYRQTVTFTATVTSASGTPGGTVQFYVDGSAFGGPINLSGGEAVTTTTALALGTHPITVTYSGDASYLASTSSTLNHAVNCSSSISVLNNADSGAGSFSQAMLDICDGGTVTFNGNYTPTLTSGMITGKNVILDGLGQTIALVGPDSANNWNLTGSDAGSLGHISWVHIVNLRGGNSTDAFDLSAFTGTVTLDGNGGTNTVGATKDTDFTLSNNALLAANVLTATLTNISMAHLTGGAGNNTFILSGWTYTATFDGAGGSDGLVGDNVTTTWNITGTNAGNVNGIVAFTAIENLTGLSGADNFVFAAGAVIWGVIHGGTGSDLLDYSAYTTSVSVNLAAQVATGTNGVYEIENITGGSAGDTLTGDSNANVITVISTQNLTTVSGAGGIDTLIGPNTANTWHLTESNGGDIEGKVTFRFIENLTGGSQDDIFVFSDGASVAGTIDGGAHVNGDALDYSAYTTSVVVDLVAGTATGTGQITRIEKVVELDSATSLTSSPNPSTYGQSVTFTATVTATTGTVQIYDNGVALGGPLTLSGGQAVTSTSALSVGRHPITATYSGDASYLASTSSIYTQTVTIPPIVYAKPSGLNSGLCESWANACELRYAITSTVSGQEIWVAAGKYTPTTEAFHYAVTFQLKNGVAIYGGFAMTETLRAQRNPAINITVLSGDLLGDDGANFANNGENSFHVVTGADGATLDGVTISGGNASGGACPGTGCGGGMYNFSSSPALTNVTFSGNRATRGGGGMSNMGSSPTLTNVTFSGNSTSYGGGGMYNNNSNPTLTNVTFSGNSAPNGYGGGMYNIGSSPTLTNVTFSGNSAPDGYGGGMYNLNYSSPTLTNITFRSNSAFSGGGMFNTSSSNPTIRNSIFWGDTGGEIVKAFSTPAVSDSVMQGGYVGGTNIITANPLLGTLGNYGGGTQTIPLLPGSSAINATSANCPQTDQRGVARGATCDIGAYESQGFTLTKTNGGNQSTFVNTTFNNPLALNVTSAYSEPVNGGQVILTAPTSGASITTTTPLTLTIASGAISQTVTANGTGGSYNVTASATGASSVTFALTNTVPPIVYAKPSGLTSGVCESWANACELRYAITSTISGQEIWAAAGTYKPTATTTDITATFQLKSGVAVYGGFAGTEITRTQRITGTNITVLSGDIDNNDSQTPIITNIKTVTGNTTNSIHVVTGANGATLDGVTITAGNANGKSPNDKGGGMYNDSSSPTLTNITFSGNSASIVGGGMYNNSSSPTLTNVTFSGNSASIDGGGMYNNSSSPTLTNVTFSGNSASIVGGGMYNNSSSPTLTSVTFSGNSATEGGGMYNAGSSLTLTNVTFSGNSASSRGGGMYNFYGSPTLTNVTFSGNSATEGGGMYNDSSSPTLTNVTFSGNSALYGGGGMHIIHSSPIVRNSILWNNTGGQVSNNIMSDPTFTDSVVQGGCPIGSGSCTNIISTDPVLGTLGNYGGSTQTIPLLPGSSAINATSANCPATDQRGVSRGTTCDIGAFESQGFTLAKTSGDSQATMITTAFTNPLGLNVTANNASEPVAGGVISFTAPASGASLAAPTTFTKSISASGAVSATVTANGTIGSYNVTASANGAASVTFALTNQPHCDTTITVANNTDSGAGSLRQAIADVCAGGTIDFAGNYTISLTSTLIISKNVTIDGVGRNITVSGNNTTRVFYINAHITFTLSNLTVANGAASTGGGLYNNNGNVSLTNVTFSSNSANKGGGIYNTYGSSSLANVTFSDNLASTEGGGIYNDRSSPSLTNVTFSGNSAQAGGGMFIYVFSHPTLTNVTFSGNSAQAGGGMFINGSDLTLTNVIIANNTGGNCGNNSGNIGGSNNLANDATCGSSFTSSPAILLGTLGNYGGNTQTIPLLPGSPAIKAASANCPATDQRGVTRGTTCDIGAFESQGFTLSKAGGDNQSTLINIAFTNSLVVSVTSAYTEPVAGGVISFTAPSSGASLAAPTTFTKTISTGGAVSATVAANGMVGSYNVTASAAGATGINFSLTNDKATTTTTLTSSPNPSNYGQSVTFTATVTATNGTPTGSVQFYADGATFGSPVTLSSGKVVTTISTLSVGTHPITATYSGDTNYLASTSGTYTQTVNCASAITVTSNADSGAGSLRQAIADICADGTITFSGDMTVTLTSAELTIDHNMTIDGITHSVTVSGNNAGRVFYVTTNVTFNLQNLTVANGNADGLFGGGGIYNNYGLLTVTHSTFSGNHADNSMLGGGGISNFGMLTVTNSIFSGNSAVSGGGISNYGTLTVTNSTFSGNSAIGGGGISNDGGTVTVINGTFSGNHADYGGGISNSGALTVTNSTFSGNNTVNGRGGGIYNGGTSMVTHSTFSGNNAYYGGGISNDLYGMLTVTNSIFSGDSAASGGGIHNSDTLTVTNSTFSGNSATSGGGIFNSETGDMLTVTNSTFSGNSATRVGGGIYNGVAITMTMKNTIVANSASGGNCINYGTLNGSNNLADDSSCGSGFTNSSTILLGTLGNYGGSTQTFPLLPGSSAIKATNTNCPTTDQRDIARGTTCDIGAYESRGFTFGSLTGTPQSAVINTAFATPLGLTVTANNSSEPVAGGVISFTAPASGASIAEVTPFTKTISASGAVSATVTANGTIGLYNVIASAKGVTTTAQFSLTNDPASTTTTLTSIPNLSTLGQAVTFTMAVTSTVGTPTGNITLAIDTTDIGLLALSNGVATYVTNTLAIGTHPVTATYSGDATYNASSGTLSGGQVVTDAPIAGLSATNSSPTRLTDATFFTATISAGSNVTYQWNFGDGQMASGATANHTYATTGNYTAIATATNTVGSVSVSTSVTITNQRPIANAGADQGVLVNATVPLDGSSSTDSDGHLPLTYGWTQTGGTAVVLSSAVISRPTFTASSAPAVLTFTLIVTDGQGATSVPDEVVVLVDDQAVTDLRAVNDSPTPVGSVTHFTATIANGSNALYAWNFGDGQTGAGAQINHRYAQTGSYTAIVTATNGAGSITATTRVTIENATLYLPLVMNRYAAAPDLIVRNLNVTDNRVQVVIQNQGDAPVVEEFWVDVYINPISAPTGVNQTWSMLGTQGLVWGVTASALPALTPGGVLTLTVNDAYFFANLSTVTWPLPVGTTLYAQVDSVDLATTYGAVLELHEMLGLPYNNILGPLTLTTSLSEAAGPVALPDPLPHQLSQRP